VILRAVVVAAAAAVLAPRAVAAQDTTALAAVEAAWDRLAYDSVLVRGRAALGLLRTRAEIVRVYELMAFAYAALDSTNRAIETFREVVYFDPDRDYDPERVSPDFIQLHRLALGRALVVRGLTLDSASFVAGVGSAQVRFSTMRPAGYEVRITGVDFDSVVARGTTSGTTIVPWSAVSAIGPVRAGVYDVTVTVSELDDRDSRRLPLLVRHGAVDTVAHLERIEGLDELPEMETQRRNWIPLALTALAAGVVTGASFALESGPPSGTRTELFAFDLLVLASGVALSLRQPPPRPVPAAIAYNQQVRRMVEERNREIATRNAQLRRQVVLTVTTLPDTVP